MLMEWIFLALGSIFLGIALTFKLLLWVGGSQRSAAHTRVEGCFETFLVMVPLSFSVMLYVVALINAG